MSITQSLFYFDDDIFIVNSVYSVYSVYVHWKKLTKEAVARLVQQVVWELHPAISRPDYDCTTTNI